MHTTTRTNLRFLAGCAAVLTVLWLPTLHYPVVSDTVNYAFLGRSLWRHLAYAIHGHPYANQLPLHAFLSYPFTRLLGLHDGMHALSLAGGIATLALLFDISRRAFSTVVARIAAVALLLHPGFVLMSMTGSADLTYTALFLAAILSYLLAADDRRWYLACGACLGFACLTRYNAAPLFVVFPLHALWKRPAHVRDPWLWYGLALAAALFGLWFLRNFLVFHNPFYSGYVLELQERNGPLSQVLKNLAYYANPLHTVFPYFFVFALFGLRRHGRRQPLLVLAMLAGVALAMIWWVQAIRFAFAGSAILLMFAAAGLADAWNKWPRTLSVFAVVIGIGLQSLSLCLYTYGACNAAFDRTVGVLPGNLGLTPEGFYAWSLARDYVNEQAPPHTVLAQSKELELQSFFRPDIVFLENAEDVPCGAWRITQHPAEENQREIFRTVAEPTTAVVVEECR